MLKRKGKVSLFGRFIAVVMTAVLLITVMPIEAKAASVYYRMQFMMATPELVDVYLELFYFKDITNDIIYTFERESDYMITIYNLTPGIEYETYLADGRMYHKDALRANMTKAIILTVANFYDGQTCLQTVYTPDSVNKIKQEQVQNPTKEGYVFTGWVDEDGEEVTFPIFIGSDDDLRSVPIQKGDIFNVYATWEIHNHQWNVNEWNYDEYAHWHECLAEGCPITENSQKDGYDEHEMGEWTVENEAQFRQDGLKKRECQICDYAEEEVIPKLSESHIHNFQGREELITAAKCDEFGLKLVYCTLEECGAYEERIIEKIPHDYETNWRYSDVIHYHKCKNCDDCTDEEYHQMTEWNVINEVTFWEDGLKERHCEKCEYKETEIIQKLSDTHIHNYTGREEVIKDSTCAMEGLKKVYCTEQQCGAHIEKSIPKKEHKFEVGWQYDEEIHYHKCENCDAHSDDEYHHMAETGMVKLATKDSPGIMELECVRCGYKDYNEVPYEEEVEEEIIPEIKEPVPGAIEGGIPPFTAPQTGELKVVHIYATLAMIAGMTYLMFWFKPVNVHMSKERKEEIVDRLIKWAKSKNGFVKGLALLGISIVLFYYYFMKHFIKREDTASKTSNVLR